MPFGAERLADALAALDPDWRTAACCVALSGGPDSAAMVHALAALREAGRVRAFRAVHVDHGLHAESAIWARRCHELCESLRVPLQTLGIAVAMPPGDSLEAAARGARYAALAKLLQPGEWLLTAHHRDDQLETVLIQLLRGSGVAGLAGMPTRARFGPGWHGRPLLDVDRAELATYARQQGIEVVQDPSNADPRFDRGWLRTQVLPALFARWPAAAATVGRSARHLAQAARLLAALAEADAAAVLDEGRLAVEELRRLPRERQANLLRWWIRSRGLRPPPAARLDAVLEGVLDARRDARPLVRWGGGEIRRYRDRLYALATLMDREAENLAIAEPAGTCVELGHGLGRLRLVPGHGAGLRTPLGGAVELRFRGGGESIRPHAARPRKRLKDLCQEAGVVPWMRGRLPLVYVGGRLAAVADLWVDTEFAAAPAEASLLPVWEQRPPLF